MPCHAQPKLLAVLALKTGSPCAINENGMGVSVGVGVALGVHVSDGVWLGSSGVAEGGGLMVSDAVGVAVALGRGVKDGGRLAVAVGVEVAVAVGVTVGSSPTKVGSGVTSEGSGGGDSKAATPTVIKARTATKMMAIAALTRALWRTIGLAFCFSTR